jgi:hypothetical protein
MPYIVLKDREKFNKVLKELPDIKIKGELEYVLFFILKKYMVGKKVNYSNLHDAVYSAQHVSDEFRRRYLDARE